MESKSDISSYRVLLDETLASKELKNEERLKDLVKKQMLQSSQVEYREYGDELVDRRTKEVANFLDMLRSTSIDDSEKQKASKESIGSWKVKQDTEEFRVMYREGPEGTPFHTLLVEGYVDGPVDVCLCISWEAALYRKCVGDTGLASMVNSIEVAKENVEFKSYALPPIHFYWSFVSIKFTYLRG
ncbi:hypothetical protein Leryth_002432, partial [Lithospermum erythrorhizon]